MKRSLLKNEGSKSRSWEQLKCTKLQAAQVIFEGWEREKQCS